MASAESQILLPRDADSGSNSTLTTGAIAGIACGAGALFLGAAGLFIVYWRRQRQYDREDEEYEDAFDERGPPGAMAPAVTYTLDYKMDDPQHQEGDHASSYTYSPEKPSYPFSPLSAVETASAMPTHPAYIPRALVRGAQTPSNRSTATTSPPPFPTPPFPSAGHSRTHFKTQPDDTMIQAYLAAAGDNNNNSNSPAPGPPRTDSNASLPSLPFHPHHSRTRSSQSTQPQQQQSPPIFTSPPNSASSITDGGGNHSSSSSAFPPHPHPNHPSPRKPRSYLPPRLNLSSQAHAKPLSGRENTTISGPLAFPQHYQGPPPPNRSGWSREEGGDSEEQQQQGEGSKRTFRSRALAREGAKEEKKGKKKKRSSFYAEVEIGNGSDIW